MYVCIPPRAREHPQGIAQGPSVSFGHTSRAHSGASEVPEKPAVAPCTAAEMVPCKSADQASQGLRSSAKTARHCQTSSTPLRTAPSDAQAMAGRRTGALALMVWCSWATAVMEGLWQGARENGTKVPRQLEPFRPTMPIPNAKSKPDKPELDGIDSTDGLVPGMQKALNHARRMEGRLHRLLRDKQTAQEQWEQYKKDSQKAFYNEKSRYLQAQENFDKEIASAVTAQKEAREQLCAVVDLASNPKLPVAQSIDDEWDRMLVDYEAEQRGNLTGVLERALLERTQVQARSAALAAAQQNVLDMGGLEDYGSQPSTTHGCGSSSRSSSIPGQGSQPLPEKVVPPQGADVPYLEKEPPGPFLASPGVTYLKQTANVSPCARVGPYEGKPSGDLDGAKEGTDLAQSLAGPRLRLVSDRRRASRPSVVALESRCIPYLYR